MTQFDVTGQHDRHPFIPARLQRFIKIDIDLFDMPAQLRRKRVQRIEQVVTQVAPLPAHDRQNPLLLQLILRL